MESLNVEERVMNIVSEQMGFEKEKLTLDTSFVGDLGSDSLDQVELMMQLEDEFGINIPEEATENVQTIGDVVRLISAELDKGGAAE